MTTWRAVFTKSCFMIWKMRSCRSWRQVNWTISAVFGGGPSLRLWQDISRILSASGKNARNGLVVHNQETVHMAASIFRWILESTLPFATWSSRGCVAGWLYGGRCGRGLLGTVMTMYGACTKCRCLSGRRIWPNSFRHGQLLKNSGWTCCCLPSPEWRLIRCSSVAWLRL